MNSNSGSIGFIEDELFESEEEGYYLEDEMGLVEADLEKSSGEAPIKKLTKLILIDAIRKGASHIYIEKERGVKYELDGYVHHVMNPPEKLHNAIGNELKRIFGIIEEKEVPLNLWQKYKRISPKTELVPIKDFSFGQIANTRLYCSRSDVYNLNFSLTKLGNTEAYQIELFGRFPQLHFQDLDKFVSQPGLYIISSPFNQGKTTTAHYVFSNNNVDSNVKVSLEEKASYPLGDSTRVIVSPEDLEYEQTLRGIRNYHPRLLFFDDVRDKRTLEESIYYASNGTSVLVTVLSKDIPGSLRYLSSLGVSNNDIIQNLKGAISQRLVRILGDDQKKYPYKGISLVAQKINASEIDNYKREIIEGDFSKIPLPSFSNLVGKLLEKGITDEKETNRIGYN